MRSKIDNLPFLTQALILFLIWIVCFGVFQLLATGLMIAFGMDMTDMSNNIENINGLKFAQILASIGSFAVPACIFSYLKTSTIFGYNGFKAKFSLVNFLITIAVIAFSYIFMTQSYMWNKEMVFPESLKFLEDAFKMMEEEAEEMMHVFLKMDSFSDFLINLIMVGFVAAFTEEILFRGTFQKFLTDKSESINFKFGIHLAIFFTAFWFSAIHMQFYGFLPRFIIGILFGYLFYYTKNLWYPIIAHLIFNGSQVVYLYVSGQDFMETNMENTETIPIYLTLGSLVLTIGTIFFLKQFNDNKQKELIG